MISFLNCFFFHMLCAYMHRWCLFWIQSPWSRDLLPGDVVSTLLCTPVWDALKLSVDSIFLHKQMIQRGARSSQNWFIYSTYWRGTKKLYKCSTLRTLNHVLKDYFCLLHQVPSKRNNKETHGVYLELLLCLQGESESTALASGFLYWGLRLPPSFPQVSLGLISPIFKLAFLE